MPWKPKKEKGPLQMEKSKASILYDKEGRTYIDCISGVSHGKINILLFREHKKWLQLNKGSKIEKLH